MTSALFDVLYIIVVNLNLIKLCFILPPTLFACAGVIYIIVLPRESCTAMLPNRVSVQNSELEKNLLMKNAGTMNKVCKLLDGF